MKNDLRIDVRELERRPVDFDLSFAPSALQLPDDWIPVTELRADGRAELLGASGSRTIRVKGRLEGRVRGECGRCLKTFELSADQPFDLFFHPMEMMADSEEAAVSSDDLDYGFYEDGALLLSDVVAEQLQLWLPMRPLCLDDCRGICGECGADRNEGECSCAERRADPRWETLSKLKRN